MWVKHEITDMNGFFSSCRCRKTCWLGLRQMGISLRSHFPLSYLLLFYVSNNKHANYFELSRIICGKLWKIVNFYLVLLYPTWIQSDFRSLCFLPAWPPWGHATRSRELLANRSGGFKRVSVVMAAELCWQARLQWLKVNNHWTRVTPLKEESILGQVRLKPMM